MISGFDLDQFVAGAGLGTWHEYTAAKSRARERHVMIFGIFF
jgi:hypothetical protein